MPRMNSKQLNFNYLTLHLILFDHGYWFKQDNMDHCWGCKIILTLIQEAMKISFEHYKTVNYDTLVNIWVKSGLPYKPNGRDSKENIENEIKLDCNLFLFAIHESKYIGSIIVTHDGRKGWINRVAVLPEYRNKGVAWQLVEAGEQWLDEQGIGIIACMIEDNNEESFEVFKKMGYIPFEGIRYLTKRKYADI